MKWIIAKLSYTLASVLAIAGIIMIIPSGLCVAAALGLGTLGDWLESGVWNEDN